MTEIWSGNISTDDAATCIQDVQIWASNSSTRAPLPQDAKLHFLSLVEVARIPLYFAAGPSCEVSTSNEATTRWLTGALLDCEEPDSFEDASREQWWSHLGRQSEHGILLSVETGNMEEHGIQSVITEMLLYAAATSTSTALPTPPVSSPTPPDEDFAGTSNQSGKTLKVYALPLCSNSVCRAKNAMEVCPPTVIEFRSIGQACFLPHTHGLARVTQPAPQKRQSISTLFEDATKKRRKLKGRGRESISQAMASIDCLSSQHGSREKQDVPPPPQNDLRRKSLSRASSMTPFAGPEPPRPTSRSGILANGKRSSLHLVESAISPRDSPTLSDADNSYAQQNKAAITKVIMAAMRLYGLQQKKKPSSKSQLPSQMKLQTETNAAVNEAEDEYKLVYHQTFRAAMFSFRKHLNVLLISQEIMRDVVDRLLTLFCTDPMSVDGGVLQEFEPNNGVRTSSPFDKPSSQARFSNVTNRWNTPTVKEF